MTPKTAIVWLKIAIEIQFVLGAVMVLVGVPPVAAMLAPLLNLVIDPSGPAVAFSHEAQLLAVIGGGVLIAWSATAWHITTTQIAIGDPRGVRALAVALVLWFATDSFGSILAGFPLNAVGNLIYVALFLPPIVGLMRSPDAIARA